MEHHQPERGSPGLTARTRSLHRNQDSVIRRPGSAAASSLFQAPPLATQNDRQALVKQNKTPEVEPRGVKPHRRAHFGPEPAVITGYSSMDEDEHERVDSETKSRLHGHLKRGYYSGSPPSAPRPPHGLPPPEFSHHVESLDDQDDIQDQQTAIFLDPSAPQDITVHIELDASPHIEDDLEEFSRLRRLGRFHAGREYFRDHLQKHLENPYILIQYVRFLLDAAHYKTLANMSRIVNVNNFPDLISCHWRCLLLQAAEVSDAPITFPPLMGRKVEEFVDELYESKWEGVRSLHAATLIDSMYSAHPHHRQIFAAKVIDSGLDRALCRDGRVWEFRDFLLEMIYWFDLGQIKDHLFGDPRESHQSNALAIIETLEMDWATEPEDDSLALAMLDIYSHLAFTCLATTTDLEQATAFVNAGHTYGTILSHRDPNNLKSRPYLMWLMAKVELDCHQANYKSDFSSHMRKQPGILIFSRTMSTLQSFPVYIPRDSEIPLWFPMSHTASLDRLKSTVKMVLRAAEELGDVELKASCLQQLAFQSAHAEAKAFIGQLSNLWLSVGNYRRLRMTYLFKYLLATEPGDHERLREDILISGEFAYDEESNLARSMILRALSTSRAEKDMHFATARRLLQSIGILYHWDGPFNKYHKLANVLNLRIPNIRRQPDADADDRYETKINDAYRPPQPPQQERSEPAETTYPEGQHGNGKPKEYRVIKVLDNTTKGKARAAAPGSEVLGTFQEGKLTVPGRLYQAYVESDNGTKIETIKSPSDGTEVKTGGSTSEKTDNEYKISSSDGN